MASKRPSAEWLQREYAEHHRSVGDIAAELGVVHSAVSGYLSQAGIAKRPRRGHPQSVFVGDRFERLTVESEAIRIRRGKRERAFTCRCECGGEAVATANALRSGNTRSCGCLAREVKAQCRHGLTGTPTYNSWQGMKQRCTDPNAQNYERYGGRGITVCESMMTFDGFLAALGERPEGMSIDRIDNDGGYWCGTCGECHRYGRGLNVRWADASTQRRNRRVDGAKAAKR